LVGIIDPITVEYVEKGNFYRIISGERRYRASKMVGLNELPCIVKEVDDHNRFLMQFIANLQREDIKPLEEAAGIRHLVETYGYNQSKVAKLLNKSRSYISQVLGLERLEEPAREIIQSASIPKEAQIQASREADPARQRDLLIEAAEDGNTIRKLRKGRGSQKRQNTNDDGIIEHKEDSASVGVELFRKWSWKSPEKGFSVTIKFTKNQATTNKADLCRKALKAALASMEKETDPLPPSPSHPNAISEDPRPNLSSYEQPE